MIQNLALLNISFNLDIAAYEVGSRKRGAMMSTLIGGLIIQFWLRMFRPQL